MKKHLVLQHHSLNSNKLIEITEDILSVGIFIYCYLLVVLFYVLGGANGWDKTTVH